MTNENNNNIDTTALKAWYEVCNHKKWFEGEQITLEDIMNQPHSFIEKTRFGYQVTEYKKEEASTVYYLEPRVIPDKKHPGFFLNVYHCICKCEIEKKPNSWEKSLVKTTNDFITLFCAPRQHASCILRFCSHISRLAQLLDNGRDYAILGKSVSSRDVKKLVEVGLLSVRTKYFNRRSSISKTYWVNPNVKTISVELQSIFNFINPCNNKEINFDLPHAEMYGEFLKLVRVVNNYLLTIKEGSPIRCSLRETTGYGTTIYTGRPWMKWSNVPSIENHPELPLIRTRQGLYLRDYGYNVDSQSLAENYWHYDVVSSVPRVIYLLNHREWLNEDIDIYELIANELDLDFSSETRKRIKKDVLTANFDKDLQFLEKTQAIQRIIGKNSEYSGIFLIEGFLYFLVYVKLIKMEQYHLNWVYDSFEFYGSDHPTSEYMKQLISDTANEFLKILDGDYSLIHQLMEDIRNLPEYKEEDYNDLSKENVEKINTLDLLSTHVSRSVNENMIKSSLKNIRTCGKYEFVKKNYSRSTITMTKYDAGTTKYDIGTDFYSLKFQEVCQKIENLLSNSESGFIKWTDIGITEQTWRSLKNRKEFSEKFMNKHGKISWKEKQ